MYKKDEEKNVQFTDDELKLIAEAVEKNETTEFQVEYQRLIEMHSYKAGFILIDTHLDYQIEGYAQLHKTFLEKYDVSADEISEKIDKENHKIGISLWEKLGWVLQDKIILYTHEADRRFSFCGPGRYRIGVPQKHKDQLKEIAKNFLKKEERKEQTAFSKDNTNENKTSIIDTFTSSFKKMF